MKLGGRPEGEGKGTYNKKELERLQEADNHADYIYEEQPGETDPTPKGYYTSDGCYVRPMTPQERMKHLGTL